MPLVDVQIVSASRAAFDRVSAQALADGIGRALGSAPGHTWVRLQWLDAQGYAENQAASPADKNDSAALGPVFVTIGLAALPPAEERAAHARALTEAIAPLVPVAPDRVHLTYAPALGGRQAFGGRWVA
jgi:phenylpyruvate tautomerase PptA (4-oxalocrotonate tautomerase family)